MQSLADQLCQPTPTADVIDLRTRARGRTKADMDAARQLAMAKYTGGTHIVISRATFDGLRATFGPRLTARHLREFMDDLATGQYKLVRIKPKAAVIVKAAPIVTSGTTTAVGPSYTLHQVAAEFGVPYHTILTRYRQGFLQATRRGKRRLVVSATEVARLRTVGLR
jgi:hypothetical protein